MRVDVLKSERKLEAEKENIRCSRCGQIVNNSNEFSYGNASKLTIDWRLF